MNEEVIDSNASTVHARRHRRYWRRTDQPVRPWWPWGFLPLMALALLFLWGFFHTAPAIERDIQASVDDNLRRMGINIEKVSATGQSVNITAVAPTQEEDRIRTFARATECATWAGPLPCPTRANVTLAVATPPTRPTQSTPIARHHDFRIEKHDRGVVLSGDVPNDAMRRDLIARAGALFASVEDRLAVTEAPATAAYPQAMARGLDVLQALEQGEARWMNGIFSVDGVARAEKETMARAAFNAPEGAPNLGALSLQVLKAVDYCNDAFAETLKQSTIHFTTASATIASDSTSVLARLADLSNQCPGALMIAGHTDAMGAETMNQILSQNRAEAVRDALVTLGIDANRLKARGFGETRPIADNSTPDGRSMNRRITIQIIE